MGRFSFKTCHFCKCLIHRVYFMRKTWGDVISCWVFFNLHFQLVKISAFTLFPFFLHFPFYFYMYEYMCSTLEARRGIGSLGAGITGGWKHLAWVMRTDPMSFHEQQQMLLIAGSGLQPLNYFLKESKANWPHGTFRSILN